MFREAVACVVTQSLEEYDKEKSNKNTPAEDSNLVVSTVSLGLKLVSI